MNFNLFYKNKLAYLTIPLFEKTGLVKHGFSTRLGGVSKNPYDSLNLGLKKDDDKRNVLKNYKMFCDAIGVKIENLVASDQVHGDKIYVVTAKDRGKGILQKSDIVGVDALITKEKQVALVTYYADCVPVFLLDVKTPAVALVHAGWRGTVKKIAKKTLEKMMNDFGTLPENVLAGIGPCIRNCCYEVDLPVVDYVKRNFDYWDELIEECGKDKWKLDLVLANKRQLQETGVKDSQIAVSDFCTSCNNNIFFSYRADKGKTGSLAAIIQLI